ncbi:DUF6702 family protein [Marinoscillum pacificum]|uniref:DUF6702 family protein n=1 Tax=Marinoscillum pacificum TaxID=392723 RepID=UPI0021582DD6|nr:DUF6702 family protein [Marinoscillum pacificum]
MLSWLLIHLCLFISPTSKVDHAIYVSVLEIESQQLKVKVFSDDLNDALRNDSSSIEEYFQKKIKLRINEQSINFNLKEVSEEGESQWITFEMKTPAEWHSFYLQADYLMELFPDQTNVVKVMDESTRYFRLNQSNPSCSF